MAAHSLSVVCNNTKHSISERMYINKKARERAKDRDAGLNNIIMFMPEWIYGYSYDNFSYRK